MKVIQGSSNRLARVFADQLVACLEECARGRLGLFSDLELTGDEEESRAWPEAARLRELAFALQAILSQAEERNALCEEFLDLCTIHGEKQSWRAAACACVSGAHRKRRSWLAH